MEFPAYHQLLSYICIHLNRKVCAAKGKVEYPGGEAGDIKCPHAVFGNMGSTVFHPDALARGTFMEYIGTIVNEILVPYLGGEIGFCDIGGIYAIIAIEADRPERKDRFGKGIVFSTAALPAISSVLFRSPDFILTLNPAVSNISIPKTEINLIVRFPSSPIFA
jgi:hypothetical protein